jgi:hypothetical protein
MAGYFRVLHGWSNAISPDGMRAHADKRPGVEAAAAYIPRSCSFIERWLAFFSGF